jgi:flagellin
VLLINDNLSALGAQNNLAKTDIQLASVTSQLSSGLQIQTAADNPAGYSIAQSLQFEINGYGASLANAQDSVSMLQTAQGALNQEEAILQTMNTLATEASNSIDAYNTAYSGDVLEFNGLMAQLQQIGQSTTYAGVNLLDGSHPVLTFQVGPTATANNQVVVNLPASQATIDSAGLYGTVSLSNTPPNVVMDLVQGAIQQIASTAAVLGAAQNQIQAVVNNVTSAQQNLTAAHANLVDVNVASATSQYTSLQLLEQAGTTVLAQAQQLPQLALKLI